MRKNIEDTVSNEKLLRIEELPWNPEYGRHPYEISFNGKIFLVEPNQAIDISVRHSNEFQIAYEKINDYSYRKADESTLKGLSEHWRTICYEHPTIPRQIHSQGHLQ